MGPDNDAYNCVVVSMVEVNCRRYPMLKRDFESGDPSFH